MYLKKRALDGKTEPQIRIKSVIADVFCQSNCFYWIDFHPISLYVRNYKKKRIYKQNSFLHFLFVKVTRD